MSQPQQNPRSTADRALMESLHQLQKTLQPVDKTVRPVASPTNTSSKSGAADPFDLNSFEQAVADIEAFMQKQQEQDGKP